MRRRGAGAAHPTHGALVQRRCRGSERLLLHCRSGADGVLRVRCALPLPPLGATPAQRHLFSSPARVHQPLRSPRVCRRGYPEPYQSNTGYEAENVELAMLLRDTADAGYLLLAHDKAGNSDGGRVNVVIDSPTLKGRGAGIVLSDDIGEGCATIVMMNFTHTRQAGIAKCGVPVGAGAQGPVCGAVCR